MAITSTIASIAGKAESLASAVTGAAGGVNQVLSAFGAGFQLPFGSSGPITLGPFVFRGFEVPESVSWGGQHQLTVHKLPGGQRVIDAMGRDDAPVTWSGTFLGPDAAYRARALDALRVAGQPLPLVWNGNSVPAVVIGEFEADERQASWVPYRISVVSLQIQPPPPAPSLFAQIQNDINGALGFNIFQAASGVITAAQAATGGIAAITGGNPAVVSTLGVLNTASTAVGLASAANFQIGAAATTAGISALQSASSAISNEIGSAGISTTAISGVAASAPVGGIVGSLSDLSLASVQAGVLAQFSAASGFVSRALANATNGST